MGNKNNAKISVKTDFFVSNFTSICSFKDEKKRIIISIRTLISITIRTFLRFIDCAN